MFFVKYQLIFFLLKNLTTFSEPGRDMNSTIETHYSNERHLTITSATLKGVQIVALWQHNKTVGWTRKILIVYSNCDNST